MKICSKCKIPKLETKFSKHKNFKDGLQYQCKECYKKYNGKRYDDKKEHIALINKNWRKNNSEKTIVIIKQWRKNHPEQVAMIQKNWRKNHSEQVIIIRKIWNENNKGRVALKKKEYRAANPESQKKHNLRRKRELGFNCLNKKFSGSVAHHVNNNDIIYVPGLTYMSIPHNLKTGKNMDIINKIAILYLKRGGANGQKNFN